ncbi:MAG: hypothetical protein ACREQL_05540 [Candidatus Binatia bacterium]
MLLVVALAVPSAWAQGAINPQTLVGQWTGSWIERSNESSSGRYHLRISKVDGDKVHCAGQFDAGRTIPFIATLTGNEIRFVGQANIIELTLGGGQLVGTLSGTRNVRFTLTKEK